jgi:hypothetical protein
MNTDRIGKMYQDLTCKEKAALAFTYMVSGDSVEVDRVEATVPARTYRMLDLEYSGRLDRLTTLAFVWGFWHWQELAVCEMFRAEMFRHAQRPNSAKAMEEAITALQRAESHLVALDEILQTVCDVNGLAAQAVRAIANVGGPYRTTSSTDTIPDTEFDELRRKALSRLAE